MKEINKLNPFGRFCCTIGNLPTSYMISLTYEEQLIWLCKYLEETVIPAVNNNAEALEEVRNLYIELKNYVDTYFDSLDIQSEINTKLDDMAESGELAEIIAQYLQLAGLLVYNTKAELKNAENLVAGSFTMTFGNLTYNDGLGNYYKIRALINTDIIDNNELVGLTNYPTLVAEKIHNSILDSVSQLSVRLNNKVNVLESKETILMGDSYGVGYTVVDSVATTVNSWVYWFKQLNGLNNSNSYTFVEGGIGFADSGQQGHDNFLDLLQDNVSSISEPELIKNIIVCGGYNDANQTFQSVNNAINAFINYCRTTFPNAKVYIGMIASDGNNTSNGISRRQTLRDRTLIAYQNSRIYGATYLNGVENVMKYYPNFGEDNYHPSENGYKILGGCISQAFNNGYVEYYLPKEDITFANASNMTFNTTRFYCQILGDKSQFIIQSGNVQFTNYLNMSSGYVDLGEVTMSNYRFTEYGDMVINTFVGMTTSDNKYYGGIGVIFVNNNNHLVVGFRTYKNDGSNLTQLQNIKTIYFENCSVIVPTIKC